MATPIPLNILGIDIGSVAVSLVEVTPDKQILRGAYEFHHGGIREKLQELLKGFNLSRIGGIAATTSTPNAVGVDDRCDNRIAVIRGARHFHEEIGAILIIGGEQFGLIRFDDYGRYLDFRSNTSCAAGTGSFLDQQARRLNLSGIAELGQIASANSGVLPKIATRCAVFAKTDLVHAQQEGYTVAEICDGLCYGLAKNVVDTLIKGEGPRPPILFAGGVSRNEAVVRHLQSLMGEELVLDDFSHLYGAVGAALNFMDHGAPVGMTTSMSEEPLTVCPPLDKKHYHEPLDLVLSDYPDFEGGERYEYTSDEVEGLYPVEVDLYEVLSATKQYGAYLGIDIGSTSTKAVLMKEDRTVLAGFYTRTAGRPVNAVRVLFAAMDDFITKKGLDLEVLGSGTTGAGRKFLGKIIGADRVIDEITAHARAAVELRPDVDTIIEIGGQDSKFTTLRKGRVTFSVMNNVCAAGTGSFIEEQAEKLQCPLSEYSARAEGKRAPMTSDRCTVFMERDINHYLNQGHSVDEVLASVLHAVRENYLNKVAVRGSIGTTLCFQGATAKNKALVAAFEQGLGRPIHVSRYCHLTGALGAALLLSDEGVRQSRFRGIGLYKKEIPVTSEVCELCTNHCKITVADMDGEKVAYGFLCGRDYDIEKFVNNNISGFDLTRERKKTFAVESTGKHREAFTIGLPAGLHLYEDLPFWRRFFQELSIKTVTSEPCRDAVKVGKRLIGAEFCAPMTALHGHVKYLLERADYVFLPFYLEKKTREKNVRRQFCYYTQYSPALVLQTLSKEEGKKLLMPLVHYLYNPLHAKAQLYTMLKPLLQEKKNFLEISSAYDRAVAFKEAALKDLKERYRQELMNARDFHVVLLGRPYGVLAASMNAGIPGIFASHGIKTFFQDMVDYTPEDIKAIEPLCRELPWHYASETLKAAEAVARTEGAYPVFTTSFKCSPDSFVLDYFKNLMEFHEKPYLILQFDEYASSVGYETRIEAAIRSFQNHYASRLAVGKPKAVTYGPSLVPSREKELSGKTLLIPNWDDLTLRLVVANLRGAGIDARLLEETQTSIRKSLQHNSGQCIPMNIITQEFMDYIEEHHLDPVKTALWMMNATVPCNLGMFPHQIRHLLQTHGNGLSRAGVYVGSYSFADLSLRLPIDTYFAYMFGGMVRRMGCRIRPYEKEKGATDRVIQKSMGVLEEAFLQHRSKEAAVSEVVSYFEGIETDPRPRPKVAIIGDLYVRDNQVMNQGLVRFIEANGGEVITTPYSSYARMISHQYIRKWFMEGKYLDVLSTRTLVAAVSRLEKIYYKYFERILEEPEPEYNESPASILTSYHMRVENTGESMDNILKIFYLKKQYPDLSLFVQTSPAFCCPSLVTEAMAREIEKMTSIPVVSITYDGTGGNKNDILIPYLRLNHEYQAGHTLRHT